MNSSASATCKNGHTFQFGSCGAPVQKLFGGTKPCGCGAFEQIYADGRITTVSFGNEPWVEVRCVKCHVVYAHRNCPTCQEAVPVSSFRKKGLFAKLG
jgi:hypothetical protein